MLMLLDYLIAIKKATVKNFGDAEID